MLGAMMTRLLSPHPPLTGIVGVNGLINVFKQRSDIGHFALTMTLARTRPALSLTWGPGCSMQLIMLGILNITQVVGVDTGLCA
jgi:hypothetical protein